MASSAIIAASVDAFVSPGIAIISRPTEHTQVMASSLSSPMWPFLAAAIIPSSSLTGIKAPESPPTWSDAMMPPFFTASFNMARAAVVPCPPANSTPISSRILATESPIAGVGARDKSIVPKGTPTLFATSVPINSPSLVILKAVFLIVSETTSKLSPLTFSRAYLTTPGPETPTWRTTSPMPTPWKAPAIKGLSSTALAKTTSFAQPMESASFVFSAVSRIFSPRSLTASMFKPFFVVPTFTDEQTFSVSARARGIEFIKISSAGVISPWTRAEKPPIKSTPISIAALSRALANFV